MCSPEPRPKYLLVYLNVQVDINCQIVVALLSNKDQIFKRIKKTVEKVYGICSMSSTVHLVDFHHLRF